MDRAFCKELAYVRESKLKKMFAIIRSTYQTPPPYFGWVFFPIKIGYRLVKIFRINIWILTGKDSLKRQISIIYAGCEKHKIYFANLVFDGKYSEISIGKWLWDLIRIVKKKSQSCALFVLEVKVNKALHKLFKNKKSFFIPCWIAGEVDISVDTPLLIKTKSHKADVSKIKKYNFKFDVTNEEYQFDRFYHSMYVPYITKVYGDGAILMPYNEMKKKLKNCDLLLIKREQEYIGGVILVYDKNAPRIWSIGIKDGNIDYLKAGVTGALDYFSMIYLKQKGYKKMNFGLSRAFLKDGALNYKKRRGLQVIDSTEYGFLVKPLSSSIVTKGFFINNPFLFIDQDGLTGAIFLENDHLPLEEDVKRILKKYKLEGVSKYVVYRFGGTMRNMKDIIPAELSDNMMIRSAKSLF